MLNQQTIDGNPYTSPLTELSDGKYDRSLFWRVMKIFYALIVVFMLIDAFLILIAPRGVIKFSWWLESVRIRELLGI